MAIIHEESSFADEVRKRIIELRITQKEVSERTGITPASLSRILRGRQRPSRPTVTRILGALGVSPDDARFDELLKRAGFANHGRSPRPVAISQTKEKDTGVIGGPPARAAERFFEDSLNYAVAERLIEEGDWTEAEVRLTKLHTYLATIAEIEDPKRLVFRATVRTELAWLHEFRKSNEAVRYYALALGDFAAAGQDLGMAMTLHNLADFFDNYGEWDRAIALYWSAIALKRQIDRPWANSIAAVGLILLRRGDLRGAHGALQETRSSAGRDETFKVGMRLLEAELGRAEGKLDAALEAYDEAFRLARQCTVWTDRLLASDILLFWGDCVVSAGLSAELQTIAVRLGELKHDLGSGLDKQRPNYVQAQARIIQAVLDWRLNGDEPTGNIESWIDQIGAHVYGAARGRLLLARSGALKKEDQIFQAKTAHDVFARLGATEDKTAALAIGVTAELR